MGAVIGKLPLSELHFGKERECRLLQAMRAEGSEPSSVIYSKSRAGGVFAPPGRCLLLDLSRICLGFSYIGPTPELLPSDCSPKSSSICEISMSGPSSVATKRSIAPRPFRAA